MINKQCTCLCHYIALGGHLVYSNEKTTSHCSQNLAYSVRTQNSPLQGQNSPLQDCVTPYDFLPHGVIQNLAPPHSTKIV